MKRSWSPSLGVLLLCSIPACGAASRGAAMHAELASREPVGASAAAGASTTELSASRKGAAFDYEHETDPDQVFLRESERSIALYRQFIERAGDDPAYAEQVRKSREQIEDLTAGRIFVLNGIAERKRGEK